MMVLVMSNGNWILLGSGPIRGALRLGSKISYIFLVSLDLSVFVYYSFQRVAVVAWAAVGGTGYRDCREG